MTTVSVIIPTKDRLKLLDRAVRSACDACDDNDEIIVVNDHSHKPITPVIEAIQDVRVRLLDLPEGSTGVSAARNAGIIASSKDVIMFLDDDDEFRKCYPGFIAGIASKHADYGFSSYLTCRANTSTLSRIRLPNGLIHPNTAFKKMSFGFGMGFWMHKRIVDHIGLLDTDLTINEDTDYACRLNAVGARGWYSCKPGVVIHEHTPNSDGQLAHITHRVSSEERARCMRVLCEGYPNLVAHLGRGYISHCLKAGFTSEAMNFVRMQKEWRVRLTLWTHFYTKRFAYAVSKPTGPRT